MFFDFNPKTEIEIRQSNWRRSQVVRQRSAKPLFIGSIPIAASNKIKPFKNLKISRRVYFRVYSDFGIDSIDFAQIKISSGSLL